MLENGLERHYAAVDIETKGLIVGGVIPPILCVSIATDDRVEECLPWSEETKATLQRVFDTYIPIFHNASFDVRILRDAGLCIDRYIDTMILSYVWHPGGGHRLEDWGWKLEFPKLEKPWEGDYPEVYSEALHDYCLQDARLTLQTFYELRKLFVVDTRAAKLAKTIETPFADIIMEMEANGLCVDISKLQELDTKLQSRLAEIEAELTQMCPLVPYKMKHLVNRMKDESGHVYDGEVVVEGKLRHQYRALEPFCHTKATHKIHLLKQSGWEPTEFTKRGEPVTDAETLSALPGRAAELLLEAAKLSKLLSTFVTNFGKLVVKRGDVYRLYGSFNQCVTVTGRLSSSKPNLQNIPSRGEMGSLIRGLFIAPPGHLLIDGDLSNIEARILAFVLWKVCGDDALVKVFQDGGDFHSYNQERWKLEQRVHAKTVLFSIVYGAGAGTVAARTGKTLEEAEAILEQVAESTPSIAKAKAILINKCRNDKGVIHTLFGRRLCYPAIMAKSSEARARAERQIFNAIIQGTSADILKRLTLEALPLIRNSSAKILLELHDEMLLECREDRAEELAQDLTKIFNTDLLRPVPVLAEFRTGQTWKDAH